MVVCWPINYSTRSLCWGFGTLIIDCWFMLDFYQPIGPICFRDIKRFNVFSHLRHLQYTYSAPFPVAWILGWFFWSWSDCKNTLSCILCTASPGSQKLHKTYRDTYLERMPTQHGHWTTINFVTLLHRVSMHLSICILEQAAANRGIYITLVCTLYSKTSKYLRNVHSTVY